VKNNRDQRSGWRNSLHLRRGVKQILQDLEIETPLDVRVLCERLGAKRERNIELVPYPLPAPGAFGLWIGTPTVDYVLYQRDTTVAHQEHIILHETGHIISGHGSNEEDEDIWAQMFPNLSPEMIRRALRRDGYSQTIEREAEMVATVIKEWATLLDRLRSAPDRRTDASRRLGGAFDDHQGWL
jgi:hypothetical protein